MSATISAPSTPRQTHHKVTSLPRSLNELQQAARLSLKLDGKVQFFNEMGNEIKTPRALEQLKEGEVLQVKHTRHSPLQAGSHNGPLKSTAQADFVHHHQYDPSRPVLNDDMSILTQQAMRGKFDGTSVYSQDFATGVPDERAKRAEMQPVYSRHFLQHSAPTRGTTTYNEQFKTQYEGVGQAQVDTSTIRGSTLTALSKGHKLDAMTSYTIDFDENGKRKAELPVKPAFTDNDSTLTDAVRAVPFEGETVYQGHYLHNKASPAQSAKPMPATLSRDLPFESGTEYSDTFVTRQSLVPKIVFRYMQS
eukprot:TRINITY_DN65043_c0_g1_i1.p1 TRINITY_DN65043_c0_g1~~TRINITY_DN65043_c0_g1_i1.p1  ORF type:complete len:307 (-),score=44.89 TRINITY_DN65043_c0_g1_i1:29-949(-)